MLSLYHFDSHGGYLRIIARATVADALRCLSRKDRIAFLVSRFLLVPLVGVKPQSAAARELTLSGSFGNPGVLPLLFFDALFAGARDASLLPRLVALTSFYLIGFTPAFWALGNAILADDDPDAACLVVSPDECEAPTRVDRAKKALTALLKPPPVRAALGGLAVAACTPLRDALVGPNARLATVFAALTRYSGLTSRRPRWCWPVL